MTKMRCFTWVGHDVDEHFASWLKDLEFSDVVVRYGIDDQTSYDNLAQRGITFWRHIKGNLVGVDWTDTVGACPCPDGYICIEEQCYRIDNSIQGYLDRIIWEISRSPSRNIYLDDCDATYNIQGSSAFNNLLNAIRQVQNNNVILCFYASSQTTHYRGLCDFASSIDLSDFDVDIYFPPAYNLTPEMLNVINARTLGMYLWCWTGTSPYDSIGNNWETITEEMIRQKFSEARTHRLARMGTWMGHESDVVEPGMSLASLYNYPSWWSLIKTLNVPTIPENFLGFLLVLGITVASIMLWKQRS